MKLSTFLGFVATVAVASMANGERDARACAVFTPDQTAPVVGHQMILSVTNTETTLWDQFKYSGPTASFGWILPIKGLVKVGVSSDAIFNALGQITAPQIFAPNLGCPNTCKGNDGAGGGSGGGVVTVLAQEVVGPFESTQLTASDPSELKNWLTQHGYTIPAEMSPIIDAYVAEGYGFLAVKLVADATLDSVRPIRVTFPGAMPSIPLRLLAAGTGNLTQATLFIVGEGRWEPSNAPVVTLKGSELTWDFKADTSDYDKVRADKLAATGGKGWLVEDARIHDPFEIQDPLEFLVQSDPDGSGYGYGGQLPADALADDLSALLGDISGSPWITRLTADLSRDAFAKDLSLGASADQTELWGSYTAGKSINAPMCPPDPCGGQGGAGGAGSGSSSSSGGPTGGNGNGNTGDGDSTSCNMPAGRGATDVGGPASIALVGLGAFIAISRRRRGNAR